MKHSLIFTLFMLSLLACKTEKQVAVTSGTSAYTSNSLPSRWSSNSVFPLKLDISSDFNASEITAVESAATSWSDTVNNLNFFETTTDNLTPKENLMEYTDSMYGVYKIYQWPQSLPSTALAVTQISGLQKSSYIQIQHADILLNYDYFSFSTDGSWGYDLQTVVVHELGHFLGLYHNQTSLEDSVMYPTISRYFDNQTPRSSDIDEVVAKYGLNRAGTNSRGIASDHSFEEKDGIPITIQLEMHANDVEILKINGKRIKLH